MTILLLLRFFTFSLFFCYFGFFFFNACSVYLEFLLLLKNIFSSYHTLVSIPLSYLWTFPLTLSLNSVGTKSYH